MGKKISASDFIEKAKNKHNNKYSYLKTEYIGCYEKIIITCPLHGDFQQKAYSHLLGRGCSKCGGSEKLNTDTFIEKAKKKHGDEYGYSKVNYKNTQTKVIITCHIHGDFQQRPNDHLTGKGCSKCGGNKQSDTSEFVERAIKQHGNKYDYSRVDYKNSQTKVVIICSIHGDFYQKPNEHIRGYGCCKCANLRKADTNRLNINEFIDKARKIHLNKYDYLKVDYKNNKTKVIITCSVHGDFQQFPREHLSGHGCSKCSESKGEKLIAKYLDDNKINYYRQYKFNNCKNVKPLPFDFYLPNQNLCVEFDGRQHFKPVEVWGGVAGLEKVKKSDKIKTKYCKDNNIKLIRISYLDMDYVNEILGKSLKGYSV